MGADAPASVWSVARRPRWIAAFVFALALAAGFAALGQWQLERSIESATVVVRDTETVVPLESITEPAQPVESIFAGQRVETAGTMIAGDFEVITGRKNLDEVGAWVVGHVVTDAGPSLAVALGWAPTADEAADALARLDGDDTAIDVVGRYLPAEAPQEADFERGEQATISVAALINQWVEAPDGVYAGYVVLTEPLGGLETIDSPKPSDDVTLNWLNLFYAVEWVVFAGFAIFLWYRLVKDAWEREVEEAAEAGESAETAPVH